MKNSQQDNLIMLNEDEVFAHFMIDHPSTSGIISIERNASGAIVPVIMIHNNIETHSS
ncbi:hypothetical protein C815_01550 [Firmicutes bacterium M10-2]|nr:hypothetical protein C815_01550 [Firmicutes bacterium M10-2]